MVRSRGDDPAWGDASLLPASVPDIGRSLRLARELADLTLDEAATRAGLRSAVVEALESGSVGPQHDRIETLRALRTYADSLGLPGDDYVLVAIEQWPAAGPGPDPPGARRRSVPVVSISSAPAGGHSPVGGRGSVWPGDATGVPDATITGVLEPRPARSSRSTTRAGSRSSTPARSPPSTLGAPRFLKVLVGLAAVLVVLGGGRPGRAPAPRRVGPRRPDHDHPLDQGRQVGGRHHLATSRQHTPCGGGDITHAAKAVARPKVTMKAEPGATSR